ncbi:TPA: hypothetical protein DEP58_04445 [Patescibacteria group bacterium]|nr:MAG: hypothetical protein UU98_C0003G0026 [Parcubacteria group bacterium GW2011_GWD2_42_14]HCC05519.1 hypothetical protein [Patescibacteria group bacterium]
MKAIIISSILAVLLIGGTFALTRGGVSSEIDTASENNVSIVDGVQIVEIRAKGGYFPRKSVAQAGVPTVVRFITNGTFDCSSAVRIPSLDIGTNLPPSGSTDVALGTVEASVLEGTCTMGMYSFEIEFKA